MIKTILYSSLLMFSMFWSFELTGQQSIVSREISIIATPVGFFPQKIVVHQGEFVRFYLTSAKKDFVACFKFENREDGPFIVADFGTMVETDYLFENAGKIVFHCPNMPMKGELTVLGKIENLPKNSWSPKKILLE